MLSEKPDRLTNDEMCDATEDWERDAAGKIIVVIRPRIAALRMRA